MLEELGIGTQEYPLFIQKGKATAASPVSDGSGRSMNLKFDLKNGFFSGSMQMDTGGAAPEKVRIIGGLPGGVGISSVLGAQDPALRGTFCIKSSGRTGRVTITPINQ